VLLEQPVDHQVGVAADGRGEVQVVRRGQAEVADVLGRVDGLHHRAQEQVVERALLGAAGDLLEQGVEALAGDLLAGLEREAVGARQHQEVGELVLVGLGVDPVHGGQRPGGEVPGHRLVRREHELLDDAVGDVALALLQPHRPVLLVEDDPGLGQVEVDGAALGAGDDHPARQLLHQRQVRAQELAVRHDLPGEDLGDLGVGAARDALHHAFVELGLDAPHPALRVGLEGHVRDQAQPLLLGLERADAAGEPLGEHRQREAGEVDRGAAAQGLEVEVGAGPDEVRHVGDGHHQPPALARALDVHRARRSRGRPRRRW
jgi:hypothetical protein